MSEFKDICCVILAGGRGTRMASADRHKVCFPVAGKAAIVHAIDAYKAAGLSRFLVVVGQMAEQVIATVSQAHPEVSFVYQASPRGTGHAAKVAVEALAAQGYGGDVMITMGDKIVRPVVVYKLLERYHFSCPHVLISTLPKGPDSTAGRVVTDQDDKVFGIVELTEIKNAGRKRPAIKLAGRNLSAAQIEKNSPSVNASMYVFRFDLLRAALHKLDAANAQGELYLTDTVEHIAQTGRVEALLVPNPEDLMAYNTPAELLAVEEVIRKREKPSRVSVARKKRPTKRFLKPAGEWLTIAQSNSPKWRNSLRRAYGSNDSLIAERQKAIKNLLQTFIKRYGPQRQMILCRAPGRINRMGRHVDHRGGYVNVMAISKEVLLAASPREDDTVLLQHLKPGRFPRREFRIRDVLREASWADWIDFVDSHPVKGILEAQRGDWCHYARAPLLRLQHECREIPLRGMDCLIGGNIPMGAGLSSSSAMVVAFAEACVALNALNVEMRDFVNICGEGEWFVGTRGGSADHAAIRTSRSGYISRIGFFPFRMEGEVKFPSQLQVVIAYSGSKAVKSADARDIFNHRIASYRLAELFLKRNWPAAAGIEHLRDLVPQRLGVRESEIYNALMRLPDRPSRKQLREIFTAEDKDTLEQIFSSHADVGRYDLRGVAMFGISEIMRAERFAEAVAAGSLEHLGRFMHVSHDGDRVVKFRPDGTAGRHNVKLTDQALKTLAENNATLVDQPGRYACSTEAIDQLVDIADATPGVIGAQLAGAGLGGCMMIVVRKDTFGSLKSRLRRAFYTPRGIKLEIHACTPVAGAGLLGV